MTCLTRHAGGVHAAGEVAPEAPDDDRDARGRLPLDRVDDGLEHASEAALVRAARLGDQAAFGRIVDLHGPMLLRYARRLTGDEHEARDIVQESFVSAWRDLAGFEGRSSVRTWLFRIVHRRSVDARRIRRATPAEEAVISGLALPSPEDPLAEVIMGEMLAALQVALASLSPPQRGVWLLREVEELSYEEIAEVTALPVGSVRGHLHRGRKALAEKMEAWR